MPCTPDSFGGDPAFNQAKSCFIRAGGLEQVAAPAFAPTGGSFTTPPSVVVTAPEGATIHVTTDGSVPTATSPEYTAPITASTGTTVVKAIAIRDGMKPSSVTEATYVVAVPTQPAAPKFSRASGVYIGKHSVTITTSTADAVIRYTTNGTPPTATSPVYSKPIALSGIVVLRAAAFVTGAPSSKVTTAAYLVLARLR